MAKKIWLGVTAILLVLTVVGWRSSSSARKELTQAQQQQSALKKIDKATPTSHEQYLDEMKATVEKGRGQLRDLMTIYLNNDPSQYDVLASGRMSRTAKEYMQKTVGASVDFSQRQHFDVQTVAVNDLVGSNPQYLVTAKSDSQQVVYIVNYNPNVGEVNSLVRLVVKEGMNEK
ncbi:hypothetical protein [Fructobacillus cardui]|uniref:hypothetical protein n=1 Tax=Fructobacillus cardui TaxID=2893170 RepID=UPI002D9DDAA0|nr:hypothetical protein R53653_IHELHDKM_00707 [Fructobacillus cardui]